MKLLHGLTLVAALFISACTSESIAGGPATQPPNEPAVRYRLVAVPLDETPPSTRNREPAPFRLRAQGSADAQIVDANNQLVRSAPANGTIFGFRTSPNRQWVLLDLNNAEYAVASVDGVKDIIRIPKRPDVPTDATVFEWRILDDDRLVGYAELPSLESTEGLTASDADGLPPRGTLVYIYTIATGHMTSVEIDDSVPQPFGISTDSYGNLFISPLSGLNLLGMRIIPIRSR